MIVPVKIKTLVKNKNPHAPIYIQGRQNSILEISTSLNEIDGLTLIEQRDGLYKYLVTTEDPASLVEILSRTGGEWTFLVQYDVQPIYDYPRSYDITYSDVYVTCSECSRRVEKNELEYDEVDSDTYCFTVCPYCKSWEDIDFKYETPDEYLNRVDNLKA